MPWDVLIRNGQCVLRDAVAPLDLAIEGGKIVELKAGLRGSAKEEIDATGLHIFPGVIDPHVHFNEPGRTDWEGFATGSAALAAGGGTCFFDMPLNSSPPTLDGPSFDFKLQEAKRSSLTDFGLWGGLTPKNLDSMEQLAERGVIGFKAFMSNSGIADFERSDDETLRKGMAIAAQCDLIVAVHAEDEQLIVQLQSKIRKERGKSWRDYLDTRPVEAEVTSIRRSREIAEGAKCRLHIVHVSSSHGIAASRGEAAITEPMYEFPPLDCWAITNETCPHYLLLSENDLLALGATAKCAPPLRPQMEVDQLRKDLAEGRINFVGSDHSPSPASMKQGKDAFAIWGGISGVQSTLSALLTLEPRLPLDLIARLTSTHVAERFEVSKKGLLQFGFDADLALVDVDATYTLTRDMLLDRHKLSPYVGRQFRGLVKRTISRGQTIVLDGKIVGKPNGKLVKPTRGKHA